jgi:hypothetical protein
VRPTNFNFVDLNLSRRHAARGFIAVLREWQDISGHKEK